MKKSLFTSIYDFIDYLEKERFDIFLLTLWIFIITSTRMLSEAFLYNYPYANISYQHIFTYAHLIIFGFATGFGAIIILKILTKEKLKKIVNLAAIGGGIALIPHIIDFVIFNRRDPYQYTPIFAISDLLENMTQFGGVALFIEFILIISLTSLYIFLKTKSLIKVLVNIIVFPIFLLIMTVPTINPLILRGSFSMYGILTQPLSVVHYLILGVLFFILLLRILKKGILTELIRCYKPYIFGIILIPFFLGLIYQGTIINSVIKLQDPSNYGNLGTFGINLFNIFFFWLFISTVYHIFYDEKSKTFNCSLLNINLLNEKRIRKISIILAIGSVGLAFSLNVTIFLLTLGLLIVGYLSILYKLKSPGSHILLSSIGYSTLNVLLFYIGYFTPSYIVKGNPPFIPIRQIPSFDFNLLIIGLVIFAISFLVFILYNKYYNKLNLK